MTTEDMKRYLAEIQSLMLIPEDETVEGAIGRVAQSVIRLTAVVRALVAQI